MAKVIMVGLPKGGVAKTTVTRNLGYELAQAGKKVLMIDFDGQANLSICCGIDQPKELEVTVGNLLKYEKDGLELPPHSEYLLNVDGVDLIPANKYLTAVETEMKMDYGCDQLLGNIVEAYREDYDYILIDTGPNEGTLTVNALCAADSILIPMDLQIFALAAVQEVVTSIIKLRRRLKKKLDFEGIVFNRYDERTNLANQIMSEVKEIYGNSIPMFKATIPQTVRIGEAHYPKADITVAGFETTNLPSYYDVAVGNVPFGNYQVDDPTYNYLRFSIHNYFAAKMIDQVRPGGITAF
ncbi:MAG: ParA family protein, partial [Oscillospiraceae bacterium]|nr:ParA family protein [Oscillospiraceae bacterium]